MKEIDRSSSRLSNRIARWFGIPDDQIQAAIKLGAAKVNVNTECQIAFANATRKFARDYEANEVEYDKKKLFDPRKFLADGVKAIQASVEERIDVFGSRR